ncbi:MAG: hypothetical protein FH758_04030 [Firmicutes bacterium]|nr:hypothetical protein [Bacillota bacterium]
MPAFFLYSNKLSKGGKGLKFLKCQKGFVTAFVAVLLPLFLLFGALGMDYGRAFILKHQLQSACDAASLAGASAVSAKLMTDPMGVVVGEKLILDPAIAEVRATEVWNQNVTSLKLIEKGVTIVDTSNHAAIDGDSDGYIDSYKWGVTAKIDSIIAGPLTGVGNEIPVTRVAISKVQE